MSSFARKNPLLLLVIAFFLIPLTASAQSGRQERRQFVDELLRTLIDSKTDDRNPPKTNRPSNRTARATTSSPATASASRSRSTADGKLREIQSRLTSLSQDLSVLVSQLHSDVNRTTGIRSLLSDSLTVSADATLLAQQSVTARSVSELSSAYQQVDRDWRLLAHRLDQFRALSSRTLSYVRRINEANDRVGKLMEIQPQLDRNELVHEVSTLTSALHNLMEDIDTDVDDQNLRYSLLNDGRQVYAQGRTLHRRVATNGSYAGVKSDYEDFRRQWDPFANRVRDLDYPYVARQLRRVQSADRNVQELLWINTEIDRGELTYLAQSLRSDSNDLMEAVTLKELTEIDGNHEGLIENAGTFNTTCSDFADLVRNGDEKDALADVYYYLADDWNKFAKSIRQIDTRVARQKHREIDRSILELRDILGVRPALDRPRTTQSAAQLENLASYYDRNIRETLSRGGRFSQDFQQKTARASNNFLRTSKSIHANLARGQSIRTLREQSNQLSKEWETLVSYTSRIPQDRNGTLDSLRRRMTPLLVDMQAMLAQ
ncbi:hypothetical protein ACFL2H_06900 [Planctomycetota bacterium]